ncbi:hypothetical protein ACFXKG_30955 [Streptomyces sp. NPDC059255]|uniref:hypothetical protein n=1 Tax=Streptomyces sp. NPDC059255 TaxID=3346793 RepID=UPI003696618B
MAGDPSVRGNPNIPALSGQRGGPGAGRVRPWPDCPATTALAWSAAAPWTVVLGDPAEHHREHAARELRDILAV